MRRALPGDGKRVSKDDAEPAGTGLPAARPPLSPRAAQAAFSCYAGLAILLWLFILAMGHQPGAVAAMHALQGLVAGSAALRRLLDDEPALFMRVLTDPRGRVQSGIVAFIEELLCRDMAECGLVTIIEPSALAYALVRLGESLLYADVLAARKPDVATASRLQQAIIEGILP